MLDKQKLRKTRTNLIKYASGNVDILDVFPPIVSCFMVLHSSPHHSGAYCLEGLTLCLSGCKPLAKRSGHRSQRYRVLYLHGDRASPLWV